MSVFQWLVAALVTLTLSSLSVAVPSTFVSPEDEDITLRSVVLTVGQDNVEGIYSKPLTDHLRMLIEQDHFFDLTQDAAQTRFEMDELRSQPKSVSEYTKKVGADGLVHLQVAKGPMGLRMELALFTKKSGLIWSYADLIEKEKFDLEFSRTLIEGLYKRILDQLPYQGLIMSRNGNKVTINRGAKSKISLDQEIEVIQVVGVQRHPEFHFVTQVQKQIIGKIRITKIDDSLSFGYILFEREPQSLRPGLKLLTKEPIFYPALATSKNESVVERLLARGDSSVMLRGDSKEWLPQESPTFGRMHLLFGIGDFDATTNLTSSGNQQGATSTALNVQFDTDFWLTRNWFLRLGINQGSAQITNPLPNSSPSRLNFALQATKLAVGYDLAVVDNIHGPRLQAMLGYSQFSLAPTESDPISFTTNNYSGSGLGLVGYMPLNEYDSKWGFGAELWYHYLPALDEEPYTSGDSEDSNITELAGTAYYQWNQNLSWMVRLSVQTFKTNFTGEGSRLESAYSTDINWKYMNAGVEYLF